MLPFCAACFAYAPPRSEVSPGAAVAFELNQEGRDALTPALGPGVVRVEGNLIAIEGEEYVLDAYAAIQDRRYPSPLDGIRLRLDRKYVTEVEERRFSTRKTLPVIGGAAVLVAGFFITRGFVARNTPPEGPPGDGGPDQ